MDYRSLLLLRAARETGVLDALTTDAGTAQEVAAETGVTERAAEVTIAALEARGYLTFVEGEGYEPTNRMLGFLTTTDLRSIGETPRLLDVADALVDLPDTMRTGDSPDHHEDFLVHDLGARRAESESNVRARVTAAVREAPTAQRVLVVGDGPGEHAREFAERGSDVTLVEAPEVVATVEPLLAHEPVTLEPRDPDDPLPAGFDLVFVPRAFRRHGAERNRNGVERVATALDGGGTAVFADVFADADSDSRSGDTHVALAAELLATTRAGRVYDQSTVLDWLSETALGSCRVVSIPGVAEDAVVGEARH